MSKFEVISHDPLCYCQPSGNYMEAFVNNVIALWYSCTKRTEHNLDSPVQMHPRFRLCNQFIISGCMKKESEIQKHSPALCPGSMLLEPLYKIGDPLLHIHRRRISQFCPCLLDVRKGYIHITGLHRQALDSCISANIPRD